MNDFILVTQWHIPASIDAVWEALHDVRSWPTWWRYVKDVTELEHGDRDGLGARHRFTWATRLPYQIAFEMRVTRLQRPLIIEGQASGDLNGHGQWQLRANGDHTVARYEWRVSADKAWMKLLAPLLRPVFIWNHGGVMRAGEAGLLQWLAANGSRPRVA